MKRKQKESDTLLKSVGNKLKELRFQKGFTSYEDFALSNDLDRKQYWRMESGANITIKSLYRLTQIHDITIEQFFKGIG